MDLGGNGIVMTLTHGFEAPGIPRAVVAFDLAFLPERSLADVLERRVRRLGGHTVAARCAIPASGTVTCEADSPSTGQSNTEYDKRLTIEMQRFFQSKVEGADRSGVFGSIQRINSPAAFEMHIALPIGETAEALTQKGRFLLFSIDLSSFRWRTTLIAVAASACFGAMALLLTYLWGSLARRQREYEEAFRRVADVMAYSPTPYARISGSRMVLDVNKAFADLVGRSPDDLRGKDFTTMIATESIANWQTVQESRRKDQTVGPYELSLRTADDDVIKVTVVGAAIPAEIPDEPPQTFGILIKG